MAKWERCRMFVLKAPVRVRQWFNFLDDTNNCKIERQLNLSRRLQGYRWYTVDRTPIFSHAGRRTDFRDNKSSDFSGEIFRERNYCPRTAFLGCISCSILSNQVISWYGSRAVGCPLGREITAWTCSFLGNEGTPPDFDASFWKRGRENVFLQMF